MTKEEPSRWAKLNASSLASSSLRLGHDEEDFNEYEKLLRVHDDDDILQGLIFKSISSPFFPLLPPLRQPSLLTFYRRWACRRLAKARKEPLERSFPKYGNFSWCLEVVNWFLCCCCCFVLISRVPQKLLQSWKWKRLEISLQFIFIFYSNKKNVSLCRSQHSFTSPHCRTFVVGCWIEPWKMELCNTFFFI